MRVHILGSAAGGGVPQWNCSCLNCRAARREGTFTEISDQSSMRRSQSSVAVSADGKRWVLLNASPDLPMQFARAPRLTPMTRKLRDSAVEAVVLTDGELDHVTGLLSLREQKELRLVCTAAVRELLTKHFPLLPTLRRYCRVELTRLPVELASLQISSLDVSAKVPPYARRRARAGDVVGLKITSSERSLVYLPALPAVTREVREFVTGCDCLLVDGTFWSDNEMKSLSLTDRTARDMGHAPITGPEGSLAWLRDLSVPRKVYIHINNTNPILRAGSAQRKEVERAGVEVAYDGMDIRI